MTADLLDPMELVGALVAARSPNPPGDERAAAGVVREAARALGLPEPEEYRRSAERPNLLIRIGDHYPGAPGSCWPGTWTPCRRGTSVHGRRIRTS